jgi:choline transporter-like protein 2/4/5
MRWLAKPIVWLGILLFIFILAIITGLSFYEFNQLRQKNDNQILTGFKFVLDANYYRDLPITWLIVGILTSILLLISILVLLALLKRLRLALAILKEASKAVGYNLFSLFWPFIPFMLQIGVFVYWATMAIYLSTSGKPIYRIAYNETIANTTNITLGGICDPNKWNISNGSNGECVFWEYGYDPQVDLDSILNGMIFFLCKSLKRDFLFIRYWLSF